MRKVLAQKFDAVVASNVLARHMQLPFMKAIVNDEMPKYYPLNNQRGPEYDVRKYAYRAARLGATNGEVITFAPSQQMAEIIKADIEKHLDINVQIQ